MDPSTKRDETRRDEEPMRACRRVSAARVRACRGSRSHASARRFGFGPVYRKHVVLILALIAIAIIWLFWNRS